MLFISELLLFVWRFLALEAGETLLALSGGVFSRSRGIALLLGFFCRGGVYPFHP